MESDVRQLLEDLLAEFDMKHGYPSLHVETPDGKYWGLIPDSLSIVLEEIQLLLDRTELQ